MLEKGSFDKSHGYEALAETFMQIRNRQIGPATVREWSCSLTPGCSILDLGCGNGVPISEVLIEDGFEVFGVDASRKMIRAFHKRFPTVQAECSAAEDSQFFGRSFDAAIAWGLIFLLPPDLQETVLRKIARALKPRGRFLFTAPQEAVVWNDSMTGEESVSLGAEIYAKLLLAEGVAVIGDAVDNGENYYYFCEKMSG